MTHTELQEEGRQLQMAWQEEYARREGSLLRSRLAWEHVAARARALKATPPAVSVVDAEAVARDACALLPARYSDSTRSWFTDQIVLSIRSHSRALSVEELAKAMEEAMPPTLAVRARARSAAHAALRLLGARAETREIDREAVDVRPEVRWFAREMERKLRENDHKGGWQDDDSCALLDRLREEVEELVRAGSATVIDEAADVANFAMMIADNEHRARLAGPAGTNTGEGAPTCDTGAGGTTASRPATRTPSPASPAPRKGGECEHDWYTPGSATQCVKCGATLPSIRERAKARGIEASPEDGQARIDAHTRIVESPSVQALDAGGEKWTQEQHEKAQRLLDRLTKHGNAHAYAVRDSKAERDAGDAMCAEIAKAAPLFAPPLSPPTGPAGTNPETWGGHGTEAAFLAAHASPAPRKGGGCEHCGYKGEPDHPRCPYCGYRDREPPSVQALDAGGETFAQEISRRAFPPPLSPPTGPSDEEIKEAVLGWKTCFPIHCHDHQIARIRKLFASHRSPAAAVEAPPPPWTGDAGYEQGWHDCFRSFTKALRAAGVPLAEEKP